MSFYKNATAFLNRFMSKDKIFRYGFNWSPMYRRTTAKVIYVSKDLMHFRIKLPLSYKNRNYVNTIFGGSMFSATDPIPMTQLFNLLDESYIIWDKSTEIKFKKPADVTLYADFIFTPEELQNLKDRVANEKEIDIVKDIYLTDKSGEKVYCEVYKTIYIADKVYYKEKRASRNNNNKTLNRSNR